MWDAVNRISKALLQVSKNIAFKIILIIIETLHKYLSKARFSLILKPNSININISKFGFYYKNRLIATAEQFHFFKP